MINHLALKCNDLLYLKLCFVLCTVTAHLATKWLCCDFVAITAGENHSIIGMSQLLKSYNFLLILLAGSQLQWLPAFLSSSCG
jgi:hypothetical protein